MIPEQIGTENVGVSCLWRWTAIEYNQYTGLPIRYIRTPWHRNKITQGGLAWLAAIFANQETNNVPKFVVLGTGTTPAAITDTVLEAEGFRKAVASQNRSAAMARIRFFLTSSEANGDWSEWGVIVKGTVLSGGTLYSRILPPGGISKAPNITLSIELRNTFTGT